MSYFKTTILVLVWTTSITTNCIDCGNENVVDPAAEANPIQKGSQPTCTYNTMSCVGIVFRDFPTLEVQVKSVCGTGGEFKLKLTATKQSERCLTATGRHASARRRMQRRTVWPWKIELVSGYHEKESDERGFCSVLGWFSMTGRALRLCFMSQHPHSERRGTPSTTAPPYITDFLPRWMETLKKRLRHATMDTLY